MAKMSVGVDIENISRFKKLNKRAIERIFTKKEIAYCLKNKMNPMQHFASRFCAKEAIIKAVASLSGKVLPYSAIEIINDKAGAPYAIIKGEKSISVKISMSHCSDKAIAFAIASKK